MKKQIWIGLGVIGALTLVMIGYLAWQLGTVGYVVYAAKKLGENDTLRAQYEWKDDKNTVIGRIDYTKGENKYQKIDLIYRNSEEPKPEVTIELLANKQEGYGHLAVQPQEVINIAEEQLPAMLTETETYDLVAPIFKGKKWLHMNWPDLSAENNQEEKSESRNSKVEKRIGAKLLMSWVVNSVNPWAEMDGARYTQVKIGIRKQVLLSALEDLKDTEIELKLSQLNALIRVVESSDEWNKDLVTIWVDRQNRIVKIELKVPSVSQDEVAKGLEESVKDMAQLNDAAKLITEQTKTMLKGGAKKELINVGTITFGNFNQLEEVSLPSEKVELDKIIEVGSKEILPILGAYLSGTPLPPTTTKAKVATPAAKKVQPRGECFRYTIQGGPYSGTKCYTASDANQIDSLIAQYNALVEQANGLYDQANSACSGSDENACYTAAMAFNSVNVKTQAIEKQIGAIVRRGW